MKKSVLIPGQIKLEGESNMIGYQLDVIDLQLFTNKVNAESLWDELTEENKDRARELYQDDITDRSYSQMLFDSFKDAAAMVQMSLEEYLKVIGYNNYVELVFSDFKDMEFENEIESTLADLEIGGEDDIEE
jgi:hypothetical protein